MPRRCSSSLPASHLSSGMRHYLFIPVPCQQPSLIADSRQTYARIAWSSVWDALREAICFACTGILLSPALLPTIPCTWQFPHHDICPAHAGQLRSTLMATRVMRLRWQHPRILAVGRSSPRPAASLWLSCLGRNMASARKLPKRLQRG
jgi:hypothetical protein